MLHRDVKPANILIGDDDRYVLSDFGIASIFEASRTSTHGLAGTADYMAPEIVLGGQATRQSDVYSLSTTLHSLLLGRAPFSRSTDQSVSATLQRVVNEEPASLVANGVPSGLASVIERAMSKDPTKRHVSAADFERSLLASVPSELQVPAELSTIRRAALEKPAIGEPTIGHETILLNTIRPPDAPEPESLVAFGPPPVRV